MRALHLHPLVPVVHRTDPARLVGMLALDDVKRLYGGTIQPASDTDDLTAAAVVRATTTIQQTGAR
jgi:hypothetical protein